MSIDFDLNGAGLTGQEQLADLESLYFRAGDDSSPFSQALIPLVERLGDKYQVDELAALIVAGADRCLQWIGWPTCLRAHQIAGFVRRDGEEPRAEAALRVELLGGLVDLKEGLLEHILCCRAIA